jgi:hypothetical protein
MYVSYGKLLFGICDVVPGFFRVGTYFWSAGPVPIFPVRTVLIFDRKGEPFHCITIPWSAKSILLPGPARFSSSVSLPAR